MPRVKSKSKKGKGDPVSVTEVQAALPRSKRAAAGDFHVETEKPNARSNSKPRGDTAGVTETRVAPSEQQAGGDVRSATEVHIASGSVFHVSAELQSLQRQRAWHLKSRNMIANRLRATVAGSLGYHSGMKEKERMQLWKDAGEVIKQFRKGGDEARGTDSGIAPLILTTLPAIDGFERMKLALEKEMRVLAKQLPVAAWVEREEQKGFGLLFLAIVIGETGDLANYANPGKVWRRLGCAPHTFDGKTLMGATWRSGKNGKLPKEEWEEFGYSPRRRSIAYLIGENLMKQNRINGSGDTVSDTDSVIAGPYRKRYDVKKAGFKLKHPDYSDMRCHLHGMLLAAKLLLRELWVEWNK